MEQTTVDCSQCGEPMTIWGEPRSHHLCRSCTAAGISDYYERHRLAGTDSGD